MTTTEHHQLTSEFISDTGRILFWHNPAMLEDDKRIQRFANAVSIYLAQEQVNIEPRAIIETWRKEFSHFLQD